MCLLGGAFVCWGLDVSNIGCSQSSIIQGHAAWHILALAGLVFMWGEAAEAKKEKEKE